MLANNVSPPASGMVFRLRIEPIGGSGSHDTSECQRSPAMRLEFASAWIGRISGWPSGPGEFGWMCNSPNSRPNALWCSKVSSWSRKKITWCAISASCTSWNCWLPSGLRRSTPAISAPMTGVTGFTVMVSYGIGGLPCYGMPIILCAHGPTRQRHRGGGTAMVPATARHKAKSGPYLSKVPIETCGENRS